MPGVFERAADGARPALEVGGNAAVSGQVLGFDFESEAAERTPIAASGLEQSFPVAFKDGEDALDGVALRREGRLHDDGFEGLQVGIEHGQEQRLFSRKEMIEAAGVGLGALQNLGDAGGGVPPFPEQIPGGIEQPVAS
jgi:hypothetical protein